jgi:hypothetical protein
MLHLILFSWLRKRLKCEKLTNSNHLEWKAGLSDTILKESHPGTIPARFGLIWFRGFRGEDLNVIFYQNMPNLHNRYKSAERQMSQKNQEYMLNYSFPCSCSKKLRSFRFIIKQQWTILKFLFLVTAAMLIGGRSCQTPFWNGTTQGLSQPNLV